MSGFAKRHLQEFLATVSFGTCSELDHSCFFSLMIFSVQKSLTSCSRSKNPSSPLPIISHNSLLVIKHYAFEISARGRSCFPWSVNFLGFFLASCRKVFRKASLSLMNEQVSRLAKSAVVQYVTVFRLILAKRVKH